MLVGMEVSSVTGLMGGSNMTSVPAAYAGTIKMSPRRLPRP